MIKKHLEKSFEINLEKENNERDNSILLEYYLIEDVITGFDELDGKTAYGIEIVKKPVGKNDETATVKNLSCCREKVIKILELLSRNTVTPVGMPYILDDMLGV